MKPNDGDLSVDGDRPCNHNRLFGSLVVLNSGDTHISPQENLGSYERLSPPATRVWNASHTSNWLYQAMGETSGFAKSSHRFYNPYTRLTSIETYLANVFYDGNSIVVQTASNVIKDVTTKQFSDETWTSRTAVYFVTNGRSIFAGGAAKMARSAKNYSQESPVYPPVPPKIGGYDVIIDLYRWGGTAVTKDLATIGDFVQQQGLRSVEHGVCLDDWAELAFTAIQDATPLDINSFQYLSDFTKLKKTVKSLIDLFQGEINVKKIADLWLSIKYGLTLTFKDSVELGKFIGSKIERPDYLRGIVRSMGSKSVVLSKYPWVNASCTTSYHEKIYYTKVDDGLLSLVRFIWDTDGIIKLENAWDLIPYSFVVDWFISVGKLLDRIDVQTYAQTLKVSSVLKSTRSVISNWVSLPFGETIVCGSLSAIHFTRWIEHTFDPWDIFRITSPENFHNLPELASILIQKMY